MKNKFVILAAAFAVHVAWGAGAVAAQGMPTLTGHVIEVLDVGSYTYLRLKTADGETWAAVNKSPVKAGADVTIHDPAEMQDFESKALNRIFPTIIFGTLGVEEAAAPQAAATEANANPHAGTGLGKMHGGMAKAADAGPVNVAKAEGPDARTVAEVNADRLALNGKAVTIRAKVVKINTAVMGTNWVHLRDGTGSATDGGNDVLVTSKDEPKLGDVVVARGVVRADVDLGSGYAFRVLVEDVSFRN
jgi:hypothetical protein